MLIARSQQVRADDLAAAFASERLRRDLPKVVELVLADEELWRNGYRTVARDVSGVPEKALADALPLAKRFVDPVLAGRVAGQVWTPEALAWQHR